MFSGHLVTFQVQGEMIGAGKHSLAVLALKRLHARVLAHVAGEFVRAGKLPRATLPVALVGPFPGVGPVMGFNVGALGVDLVAARVGAAVDTLVPLLGLGIVVEGVHDVVGQVGREGVGQEVWVERLVLQRGGRVGVGWCHDVGVVLGVVLEGGDTGGASVHTVLGLVGVGLGVDVQVAVDHGRVLGIRWGGKVVGHIPYGTRVTGCRGGRERGERLLTRGSDLLRGDVAGWLLRWGWAGVREVVECMRGTAGVLINVRGTARIVVTVTTDVARHFIGHFIASL